MKKSILSFLLTMVLIVAIGTPFALAAGSNEMKQQRETEHFVFFCTDQDAKALDDLEASFEGCYDRVTSHLGVTPPGKTRVNVYPDIQSFHNAVGRPSAPDTSIGEAKNGMIYMTSPLNPGPAHSYDDIITSAVHEFVHIVIDQFHRNQPSYLNEGVSVYEAGQNGGVLWDIQMHMRENILPSLDTLQNMSSFGSLQSQYNVYSYGYAYVDFIVKHFGFDKIIALLQGTPRTTALGVDDQYLNELWLLYLKSEASLQGESASEHFTLHYADVPSHITDKMLTELEELYTKLETDFKTDFNYETTIYIYWNVDTFHDTTSPLGAADGAAIRPDGSRSIYTVLPVMIPDSYYNSDRVLSALKVESARGMLWSLSQSVPDYLVNGIADYVCGKGGNVKETVRKAVEDDSLPLLADLEQQDSNLFGYAYVDFIIRNYGFDTLISMLNGQTLSEVSGVADEELEEKWIGFLNAYESLSSVPSHYIVGNGSVPSSLRGWYRNLTICKRCGTVSKIVILFPKIEVKEELQNRF